MVVLFLAAALGIQQSNPPGTFDDPNTKFHSAGIRGTIDPGGYAASAAVKSQAEFYQQLTDLETAALRPAWTSCSESDPRHPAVQLLAHGDFAGAEALLERFMSGNNDPPMHQLLGLAYEGTGQLEAAAEQFRMAAATRPDDETFFSQGVALLLSGEVTRAEAAFHQSGTRASEPGTLTYLGLAAARFERGQAHQALEMFLDAAVAKPDQAAAFTFLATAIRSADSADLARCIEVLTSLTQKAPNSGYARYALACVLAARNASPDDVITQLQKALALAPRMADAHFRLAEMYAAKESLAPAISEYLAALDCDSRLAEAHYRLGQLYGRSGQQSLAKQQLELHKQMRAQQKNEIENGRVPIRLHDASENSCR